MSYNTGYTEAVDLPIRHCIYNDFQELKLPYRYAQQVCRDQNLEREDYISKSYTLEKYRVTYLAFLPPIKPDDIPENPTCNAPPRQKALSRLKKTRIRRKIRLIKSHHCSICGSSKHKRQSCAHRRDTEEPERRLEEPEEPEEEPEEQKQDSSSDSEIEIERARIETEPQKALREYTRQEEMQAAKEDELERQIIEDGERLLTLAIVSSDSEQEGGET